MNIQSAVFRAARVGGDTTGPITRILRIRRRNTMLIMFQKREESVVDSASPAIGSMLLATTSMSPAARDDHMEGRQQNEFLMVEAFLQKESAYGVG